MFLKYTKYDLTSLVTCYLYLYQSSLNMNVTYYLIPMEALLLQYRLCDVFPDYLVKIATHSPPL